MEKCLTRIENKLTGHTENLRGDVSTGLCGDVDNAGLTDMERAAGVDIKYLLE